MFKRARVFGVVSVCAVLGVIVLLVWAAMLAIDQAMDHIVPGLAWLVAILVGGTMLIRCMIEFIRDRTA
jgi:hypothetical protein